MLSSEIINKNLDPSIGLLSVIVLKSTDSTNNEAKRFIDISDDVKFRTVFFAEEQTSGRGRQGKDFASPPGDSLYASFILRSLPDANDSVLITVAASVAVARAVKKIGVDNNEVLTPKVKWVNDIFLNGRKICGILTEAVSDAKSGMIGYIVLGIGININVDPEDYPEGIRNLIGDIRIDPAHRNLFAATLINEVYAIQNELAEYISKDLPEPAFMPEYREMSSVLNKKIDVIRGDDQIRAEAISINGRGELTVKYETGETEVLNTGEVTIRSDN